MIAIPPFHLVTPSPCHLVIFSSRYCRERRGLGLNQQPVAYEATALPLSYHGLLMHPAGLEPASHRLRTGGSAIELRVPNNTSQFNTTIYPASHAPSWTRTSNIRHVRAALYQLSYGRKTTVRRRGIQRRTGRSV